MPAPFVHRTASVFGTLRNRELRAFWLSDWVSDAGSFVTFIALAVYVNQLTGSPAAVGLALALRSIPWFTFGPFAGVLADRLDRRSVMIVSNLARAALVALLPFTETVWLIYVIAFASACFGPLFRSARSALLPLIAPERQLVPALAVLETTHQTLHTIGPAFGGLVVLLVGARWAFFVDAASFVGATVFLLAIPGRGRAERQPRAVRHDLADGVRKLFATPPVLAWVLLEVPLALGSSGVIALLVPYVRDQLGRPGGVYGIVLAVAGLGTVVSSLVIASRDDRHSRAPWALASVLSLAAFIAVLGNPSFLMLLPIAFVSGLGEAGIGIPMTATLAETLPDDIRGRAYSVANSLTELASAAGSIGFAWLGEPEHLGVGPGIALASAVGAGLGVLILMLGGAAIIRRRERDRLFLLASTAQPAAPKGHEPLTDQEIRAATVGDLPVHGGPIHLADYDPAWPELFAREARRIEAALGERALRIEHVGSTSVPGLSAKPIIDIVLVVPDSADELNYVPKMEEAGYVLRVREPDWYEHRMFRTPDAGVQVHVYTAGCPEIERNLLFRDRLRTHPGDRELYERTKRELAGKTWKYVQNYADAKGDVVEQIIARARAEAR